MNKIGIPFAIYIDENLEEKCIGCLTIQDEYFLMHEIYKLQQKYHMYDEIKYSYISQYSLPFYEGLIKLLENYQLQFFVINFDRNIHEFSYIDAISIVHSHINHHYLVFFDYFSCPQHFIIEEKIKQKLPFVIHSMRQNSKGNILIQICDLMLGLQTRNPKNISSPHKRQLVTIFQNMALFTKTKKCQGTPPLQRVRLTTKGSIQISKGIARENEENQFSIQKDAKFFVAGHRGLVGSAIVRKLQSLGHKNIITKTRQELNLLDQEAVKVFFENEKPDYVFLAAAKVGGIHANNEYPAEFIYENLQIQNNVIHHSYLSGVKKLLFLGSSCIYPKNCPQPIKEEYLLTGLLEKTNEPYALAKITGIKMCQSYNRQYGTNFIACMPTNLYGPGDNFDLNTSHVLPALMRKFHEAKLSGSPTVTCRGDGTPMREFLYVDDLADACYFLMGNFNPTKEQNENGNIFLNIGTGKDITIKDLAVLIRNIVGFEGEIIWDTSKPNGTMRKVLDVSRIMELGWEAKVRLEDGVKMVYQKEF